MSTNPFVRDRLFCPGPTPVPHATALAEIRSSLYHRTEEFYSQFQRCQELLAPFFGTKKSPLILTCSGTGAMEAALTNVTAPGDSIIVLEGGKFGERWRDLGKTFGCDVHSYKVEWGHSPKPADLAAFIKTAPKANVLFMQANETSTGVFYPLKDIVAAVKAARPDMLIVVDAISALVAHEMRMDEWGIDCVLSGSQKGFGVPPGLAFIALSDRAWERSGARGTYYFNLKKERDNQLKGQTAFTPAISLIMALKESLEALQRIGVEACLKHHARLAEGCRHAVKAMGLELFVEKDYSHALTAIKIPEVLRDKGLTTKLRKDHGFVVAGGQDSLKNKILRISHLGFVDEFDLLSAIGALEVTLHEVGYKGKPGAGSAALVGYLAANPR